MPVNKKDIIPERYEAKLKKSFQPTEVLMADLCKRWHLKVLFSLEAAGYGAFRFKDIREKSGCTSDKMLDKAITELCDDGMVKKNFYPESPNRPDYILTERGRSLLVLLHQLEKWVLEHQQDIMDDRMESIEMREKYDK